MIVGLINKVTEYVKLKVQQIRLQLVGHLAKLISHLLVIFLLTLFGIFILFFLSFALSVFLNSVLESAYLGYVLVAAAYFIGFVIVAILARGGHIQAWLETQILKASDQIEGGEDE